CTTPEVAAALHVNEPAAKKRITRALDKLRKFFARRGVVVTATAIAGAMSASAVQAAPANLAPVIGAAAISKGLAVSLGTQALIKSSLKLMTWAKAKTAVITGAAALACVGVTTVAVETLGPAGPPPLPDSDAVKALKQFVENPPIIRKMVIH